MRRDGVKPAIGAFGKAKRNMDVDTGHNKKSPAKRGFSMFQRLFFTFLAAAAAEALVAKASKASTNERSHNEQPQLRHSQRVL